MQQNYVVDRPTKGQVEYEKRMRKIVRDTERFQCLRSKEPSMMRASQMASNGFGVDDIITECGVTRMLARRLVLGL